MLEHGKKRDAAHESNQEYRLIVENANEAILVAQDSVFVFSNPKAESLFGYSRAELESQRLANFVHKADRKMVKEHHERMLSGEPFSDVYSFRIQCKSGEIKWVDLKVALFQWKNRPAVLSCMTDITERKRTEGVSASSERKLFNILVNTPQIVIKLDPRAKDCLCQYAFFKADRMERTRCHRSELVRYVHSQTHPEIRPKNI